MPRKDGAKERGYGREKNSSNEIIISNKNDLAKLIKEYIDKGGKNYYFRGENKDNKTNACVPGMYRNPQCSKNHIPKADHEWFMRKLEALGVGLPYWFPDNDNITLYNIISIICPSAILESELGKEKIEALKTHYIPDFNALHEILPKTDEEISGNYFLSSFLDITSDIMVALHFACSKFHWLKDDHDKLTQSDTDDDCGYLFIFDTEKIKDAKYIKLIFHSSYSYFTKRGKKLYYQPFDRITHQRGAFLAPQKKRYCR